MTVNSPAFTSDPPQIHHRKTTFCTPFLPKPQQKRVNQLWKKLLRFVARRGLWQVGCEPLVGGIAAYAYFSEAAVAFELRLGEPLVRGAVVGEGVVFFVVVDEVGGETVGESGFDVEDLTDGSAGIEDGSLDAVIGADRWGAGALEPGEIEIDLGAAVDAAFADGHADA